jgi:hypothetical protein
MSVNLVETTATKYLANFLKMREEPVRPEDPVEPSVVSLEDTFATDNVILTRFQEPRFYGGAIGQGERKRPVWVYCMKQALAVNADRIHLYEKALGTELLPLWPYA